MTDISVAK